MFSSTWNRTAYVPPAQILDTLLDPEMNSRLDIYLRIYLPIRDCSIFARSGDLAILAIILNLTYVFLHYSSTKFRQNCSIPGTCLR